MCIVNAKFIIKQQAVNYLNSTKQKLQEVFVGK